MARASRRKSNSKKTNRKSYRRNNNKKQSNRNNRKSMKKSRQSRSKRQCQRGGGCVSRNPTLPLACGYHLNQGDCEKHRDCKWE